MIAGSYTSLSPHTTVNVTEVIDVVIWSPSFLTSSTTLKGVAGGKVIDGNDMLVSIEGGLLWSLSSLSAAAAQNETLE